jgi:hypothetical protein
MFILINWLCKTVKTYIGHNRSTFQKRPKKGIRDRPDNKHPPCLLSGLSLLLEAMSDIKILGISPRVRRRRGKKLTADGREQLTGSGIKFRSRLADPYRRVVGTKNILQSEQDEAPTKLGI